MSLKIGLLGFGGPAAHFAMLDEEVVKRRSWLTREQLLDMLGLTNIIPGPNSTEMILHVGLLRGGLAGLVVAGACFILPAAAISVLLAWFYSRYGSLPQVQPFLMGIKAAVLSLIVVASYRIGHHALRNWRLAVLTAAAGAVVNGGMNEILVLLGGGVLGAVWIETHRRIQPPTTDKTDHTDKTDKTDHEEKGPGRGDGGDADGAEDGSGSDSDSQSGSDSDSSPDARSGGGGDKSSRAFMPMALATTTAFASTTAFGLAGPTLAALAVFFLKVGATLYGSGYVLVSFLEVELVRNQHWLAPQQLLDAVAAGQITPGPLLSTAAFVGYLLAGVPGAAISTVAIFLPSFVFVVLLRSFMPHLRKRPILVAFVDAVSACAVGLILLTAVRLGVDTLTSWQALLVAAAALVASAFPRISSIYVVLGGGVLGWLLLQLPM